MKRRPPPIDVVINKLARCTLEPTCEEDPSVWFPPLKDLERLWERGEITRDKCNDWLKLACSLDLERCDLVQWFLDHGADPELGIEPCLERARVSSLQMLYRAGARLERSHMQRALEISNPILIKMYIKMGLIPDRNETEKIPSYWHKLILNWVMTEIQPN